ncbi:MAG: carotenoid oxygenase family protein [Pacificimonas sp.]
MATAFEATIRKVVGKGLTSIAGFNRSRMPKLEAGNPFLTGVHEPLTSEESFADLKVSGTIPPELDGKYLRNGPNPIGPDPNSYHWFTGDGMIHGMEISNGAASIYRNRWVRSTRVSQALGEAPKPGPRGIADTANTNIIGHAGRYWAIVEAGGYPVELDGEQMTIAHNPFDGTLNAPFSAHPHCDPATGNLHAITYRGDVHDRIWHVTVDPSGRVIGEDPIRVTDGPSIHDCAITADHVLVFDMPVTFSMKAMIGGQRFPYRWNPDHAARVGLCPLNGSAKDTVWYDVDPCYVFHTGNAFQASDGNTVVDVVTHDRVFSDSIHGPDSTDIRLERWTIDPGARQVSRTVLDDSPQEFPRYDERRTGQDYRYLYAVGQPRTTDLSTPTTHLVKTDLKTGTRTVRRFPHRQHPGEFVFIPRSEAGAEDDGWLMGLVIDAGAKTTDLVILNADDFRGEPQAAITIPRQIPPGFHGNWIPAAS